MSDAHAQPGGRMTAFTLRGVMSSPSRRPTLVHMARSATATAQQTTASKATGRNTDEQAPLGFWHRPWVAVLFLGAFVWLLAVVITGITNDPILVPTVILA